MANLIETGLADLLKATTDNTHNAGSYLHDLPTQLYLYGSGEWSYYVWVHDYGDALG